MSLSIEGIRCPVALGTALLREEWGTSYELRQETQLANQGSSRSRLNSPKAYKQIQTSKPLSSHNQEGYDY